MSKRTWWAIEVRADLTPPEDPLIVGFAKRRDRDGWCREAEGCRAVVDGQGMREYSQANPDAVLEVRG